MAERYEYEITTQWDGTSTGHDPIRVTLSPQDGGLDLEVLAPFFNDPPSPGGPAGEPRQQLWDYEVVEVFFLSKDEKYLEVELCPHGQHLVLLLDGCRNMIKDLLPLSYTSSISGNTWSGRAHIPSHYFPPAATSFNAYAIHGSGEGRMYEALYSVKQGQYGAPDFHRLSCFQPAPFSKHLPQQWTEASKILWNAL